MHLRRFGLGEGTNLPGDSCFLPLQWVEGRELHVLEADPHEGPDDSDTWSQEMDILAAEPDDPEDWAHIEAALADADIQAKAYVRREMGLP